MLYPTPNEAYLDAVQNLIYRPTYRSSPRGEAIREILHYQFTVEKPGSQPLVTLDPERNERLKNYTQAEFQLYAKGAKTAEEFGKASKFWLKLANPDGTINSAYGHLIFFDRSCGDPNFELDWHEPGRTDQQANLVARRTPWEWARLSLIQDKDTRQAILKFHKREHLWFGNKDQVCTIYANMHIRQDRLHFVVHMRSNDVMIGLPFDMPYFCLLQERMVAELKAMVYPDLQVGTYTHSADSLHLYDRDLDKAHKLIGHLPQNEFPI